MNNYKYLHIMPNEKFIASFIEFLEEHLNFEDHYFLIIGGVSTSIAKLPVGENIQYLDKSYYNKLSFFKLNKILKQYTSKAEKIIFHSLNSSGRILFLYLNQNILPKCYWLPWGSDLYIYNNPRTRVMDKILHHIRKQIFSKMGYLVTGTTGDYELAKKWYSATGKHIKCFNYPSNLYKEIVIKPKKHSAINILIGNSTDPTNNHIQVFEKLYKYKDKNVKIIVPLSYGNYQEYTKKVIDTGTKMFGTKVVPLTEFLPFEKYLEFLADIDIAIFNHTRQQALGNIITLLGMGKKVYIRKESTLNGVFEEYNIKVYDTNFIDLQPIDKIVKQQNIQNVKSNFSKESLVNSLRTWLS